MANTFKFGTNGNWAVKEDYALAYNDENGNFKPLPFDFTRASTATRVNKDGLIENVPSGKPRIDFLNNTSGHLLLEPSRENKVTYSEDLSDSVYVKTRGTVTTNTEIAPDGTLTADTWTATDAIANLQGSVTVSIGVEYTVSVYLKRKTGTGQVSLRGVKNTSTPITITDDWQRYSVTLTTVDTAGRFGVLLDTSGDEVYAWGFQLEAGSYATSYIPTEGSTVTRSAEEANGAGNSTVFNDSEGVLYVEFAALANDLTHRRIAISNGTTSNFVYISFDTASNRILANANGRIMVYTVSDETEFQKAAVYYNTTAPKLFVNGVLRETETAMTAISGLNEFAFDNGGGGNDFYGKVKDVKVYDTGLSDSELQALTS